MSDSDCIENPYADEAHGFARNASHSEGRYVCTCEGWNPEEYLYDKVVEALRLLEEGLGAVKWDAEHYERKCRDLELENKKLREELKESSFS